MNILERLSKREKIIVYILATIIILSFIYNLLLEPLYMRWKDIDSQTRLTKVKLQKSLSIIKDKERIDKEYAAYADRLKPKSSDEEELTSILNELETLARNANLKIVSMRPRQPKDMDYYKTFTVEADTESDMGSLMKFIYDVKNSQQLIKIDKLNINTKSSQEGVIIKAAMVISKISL